MRFFGKLQSQRPAIRRLRWALPGAALLALAAFRPAADDPNPVRVLAERLASFYATARLEKVYLHLDRPVYGTGETIWFNAYLVDGLRHRPDSLSRILYVELLSPQHQLVARRTLRVEEVGLTHGDIELDDTLRAGTYVLRAYTNWMRNQNPGFFYQRQLQVWPAAPDDATGRTPGAAPAAPGRSAQKTVTAKTDVQFFPEGAAPPGPALLLTEVRGFIVGLAPRPLTSDGKPATWRVAKS
ncbi:MAG: hypothetical protein EOO59_08750, partial [Hymenobacter sp.]